MHLHCAVRRQGRVRRRDERASCRAHRCRRERSRRARATAGFDLGACIAEGVGRRSARRPRARGFASRARGRCRGRGRAERFAAAVARAVARSRPAEDRSSSSIMQNDVSPPPTSSSPRAKAIESIEHVKRYTAMGFGTDQGKLGQHQRHRRSSRIALGHDIASTGTTTFRPNYTPVTLRRHCGPRSGRSVRPDPQDRHCTNGTWSTARCSRTSASGSGRGTTRRAGEIDATMP